MPLYIGAPVLILLGAILLLINIVPAAELKKLLAQW